MIDLVKIAVQKGAKIFSNVSGGKDSQAMTKVIAMYGLPIEGLIHADLGRVEWHESHGMCQVLSDQFSVPLHVVRRSDGRDMIDHWKHRLNQLRGTGTPFWSSSNERYCTSDMKRDPIDVFYRNCGADFIISAEGIRANESSKRAKKDPFTVRTRASHKFYKGMTAEEAIRNFQPGKRLAITWYPIFNFTTEEVWNTYQVTGLDLHQAREIYQVTGQVPESWPFHPAYVYGNDRVSCVFCVMGCIGDLTVGARHRPELLDIMIQMEEDGKATFKNKWSLKELLPAA